MIDDGRAGRRIYLLRHGETLYSADRPEGTDLTEQGYRQMEALAELFGGIALDAVYSSPIGRALVTARTIARPSGAAVAEVDVLRELKSGGVGDRERAEYFGLLRAFFLQQDVGWDEPYCGGETFRQLRERVLPWFEALLARPSWRRVAIVAHGGTNRALLGRVIGDDGPGLPKIEQDFGCLNIVDVYEDQPVLRLLNFTAHDPLKTSMEARSIDLWYEHAVRGLTGG